MSGMLEIWENCKSDTKPSQKMVEKYLNNTREISTYCIFPSLLHGVRVPGYSLWESLDFPSFSPERIQKAPNIETSHGNGKGRNK